MKSKVYFVLAVVLFFGSWIFGFIVGNNKQLFWFSDNVTLIATIIAAVLLVVGYMQYKKEVKEKNTL